MSNRAEQVATALDALDTPTANEVYRIIKEYPAKDIAAAIASRTYGNGGSQPITREMFQSLSNDTNPPLQNPLTWTKQLGDDLVDLTDPLNPEIITAGVYALSCYALASNPADGTFFKLDIELDADNDDADNINTAPVVVEAATYVGASVTYYCPAGAVLHAAVQHDITAGAVVAFKARLQRLS